MKYLLLILSMSILLAGEMEVDGDLKVTGTVESATIDSLQQQINSLLLLIADLEFRIANMECLNTGIIPDGYCDCYGNALDLCGVCDGDDMSCTDCAGVLNGDSTEDNCGNCDNDSSNDCLQDCFGEWGGSAELDACGECGGDAVSEDECYSVYDYDGNGYTTIQIGEQLWMAENLKVTHYNNGDEISYPSNEDFGSYDAGQYGVYDNDPANADIYGNLYNWPVVNDDRGVCPDGFHVPSDNEYTVLTDYLGGEGGAGGKMKEAGLEHWNSPNTDATNESGFTGLPAGYRYDINGTDYSMGSHGYFWSSSAYILTNAWFRKLSYNGSSMSSHDGSRPFGLSIRCLGD